MTLEMEQNANGFELFDLQITRTNQEPLMMAVDQMVCVCKPDCTMHWRGSWALKFASEFSVCVHTMLMHPIDGPNASHQRNTRGFLISQHQTCGRGLEAWRETLKLPKTCASVGHSTSLASTSWHACLCFLSTYLLSMWFLALCCFSTNNKFCHDTRWAGAWGSLKRAQETLRGSSARNAVFALVDTLARNVSGTR